LTTGARARLGKLRWPAGVVFGPLHQQTPGDPANNPEACSSRARAANARSLLSPVLREECGFFLHALVARFCNGRRQVAWQQNRPGVIFRVLLQVVPAPLRTMFLESVRLQQVDMTPGRQSLSGLVKNSCETRNIPSRRKKRLCPHRWASTMASRLGDRGFHVGEVVVVTNQPTLIS